MPVLSAQREQRPPRGGPRDRNSVQSLLNGLAVLRCFDVQAVELGLTEISRRSGLPKRSTLRLVHTLHSAGYLAKNARTSQYRLGVRVLDLGFALLAGMPIRDVARPWLKSLLSLGVETASLTVLDEGSIVYLEHLKRPTTGARLDIAIGSRQSAVHTALGKAMLAALSDEQLESVIPKLNLTPRTPLSVASVAALRHQLAEIRRRGFAMSDQEHSLGVRGVAATIRERDGELAGAIGVLVLLGARDLDDLQRELGLRVREAADEISAMLGYRPNGVVRAACSRSREW